MVEDYIWISKLVVVAIHNEQVSEHGGSYGIRDGGLLDSALANPKNICTYNPNHTIASLASSYGFSIAKNHPFIDGNKRTAFQTMLLFLNLNGKDLDVLEPEVVITMQNLADSTIDQLQFTEWIESHLIDIENENKLN